MPSYVLRTPICVLRAPAHLRARARVPGVRARPARQPFLGGPLLVPRGVAGRVGAEVQQQPGLQGRGAVLGRSDADPEPSKEAASSEKGETPMFAPIGPFSQLNTRQRRPSHPMQNKRD